MLRVGSYNNKVGKPLFARSVSSAKMMLPMFMIGYREGGQAFGSSHVVHACMSICRWMTSICVFSGTVVGYKLLESRRISTVTSQ